MVRIVHILFFSCLIVMMSGCARKQKEAKTTFQIFGNNLVNGTPMLGGIYLWAEPVGSGVFTKAVLDAEDSADIPFGTYNFHVVGFEGPNSFQGNRQCGSSVAPVVLDQATATVEMDLNYANCYLPKYSKLISEVVTPLDEYIFQLGLGTIIPGGSGAGVDGCQDGTVDQFGNVYCAGSTTSSLADTNGGGQDILILKIDRSGRLLWVKQFGSSASLPGDTTGADICHGVEVDENGFIYCAGSTSGSLGEANGGSSDVFLMKLSPEGELVWVTQLGASTKVTGGSNAGIDKCWDVAVDSLGNVYCTGETNGDMAETNGGSGKKDIIIVKVDPNGDLLWVKQLGSVSKVPGNPGGAFANSGDDYCNSITLDSTGNIYCAGTTDYILNDITTSLWDAFVLKLDVNGDIVWLTQLGDNAVVPGSNAGQSICHEVRTDNSGNVYCSGQTQVLGETGGGSTDAFVMKLNSTGGISWLTQLGAVTVTPGGSHSGAENCYGLALDSFGNVYCSGSTNSSMVEQNAGGTDAFVLKLNNNGSLQWVKHFGQNTTSTIGDATANESCLSLSIDIENNLYCVGGTQSDFGDTNAGSQDAFVIKMRSDGSSFPSSGGSAPPTGSIADLAAYVQGGGTTNVSFSYADDVAVSTWKLEYAADGVNFSLLATDPVSPYSWAVPAVNTMASKLRITITDSDAQVTTYTTAAFAIDSTSPTGSVSDLAAIVQGGLSVPITFTYADDNVVTSRVLEYAADGSTFSTLATNATSPYSWSVPVVDTSTSRLRIIITDASGNVTTYTTASFSIDSSPPVDNGANLQFVQAYDNDGNDVAVTWTSFSDANLFDHRLYTYADSACTTGMTDMGLTGSNINSDSMIIDGLPDGTYWAIVEAQDAVGNFTQSSCSTDSIIIDTTAPTDNTANVQFTDVSDPDGNAILMTWTAFTDTYLSDYRITTYSDSGCTTGAIDHGLTGSSSPSDTGNVNGLTTGTYYATVTAYDAAGNSTVSACSTDSITVP